MFKTFWGYTHVEKGGGIIGESSPVIVEFKKMSNMQTKDEMTLRFFSNLLKIMKLSKTLPV